jgi:hypothetical protein
MSIKNLLFALGLLAIIHYGCGCGGIPEDTNFQSCTANGIQVDVPQSMASECFTMMANVQQGRQELEARFGPVDISGWRFRFVSGEAIPGHNSVTIWDGQLVIIGGGGAEWIPHELHHVQLGPSSADHHGWCLDYEPWELATLGLDESAYLGCHS